MTTNAIFELWLSTYYEKDKYYTGAAATVQPYNNNNSSNWNRHSVYSIGTWSPVHNMSKCISIVLYLMSRVVRRGFRYSDSVTLKIILLQKDFITTFFLQFRINNFINIIIL